MRQQIEAMVFASEEAVTLQTVRLVTGAELDSGRLHEIVEQLNLDYDRTGRSFRIHRIAGGYRFLTTPEHEELMKKLLAPKIRRRLSRSVLEVLSVVAYNQPVTRGEIQQIRGSSPDYALDRLLERGFIEVSGRADSPGKPLQYVTTKDFLDLFHLPSLKDLPKLREIKEIMQEQEGITAPVPSDEGDPEKPLYGSERQELIET
ncbi:MAG: SMC-Scp complex subunit ScpB [Chlorobiaceae bacterium]|nr:SMC-Scp complex subunit ScpB [Chlorobiaceae bacterium]